VICGAEIYKQMSKFTDSKEGFLRGFLNLKNGIPSLYIINKVFCSTDSHQSESCSVECVNSISQLGKGQVIAIDGKTLRGAKSSGKNHPSK